MLLFGAASVENALDEVLQALKKKHPDVAVRTNFGATSTLAQQVMQGAEADLFLSANTKWADALHAHQPLVRRQDLLSNELVVVVLKDSMLKFEQPQDLLSADLQRLALADTQSVPAGIYARQALERLGLWDQLEARVAAGSDVRQALAFVETGAAQAGIVYRTDALVSDKVKVALDLDPKLSDPIRYPWLLLHHGTERPAAPAIYEFVLSEEAAEIFRRHGFSLPEAKPETAAGP